MPANKPICLYCAILHNIAQGVYQHLQQLGYHEGQEQLEMPAYTISIASMYQDEEFHSIAVRHQEELLQALNVLEASSLRFF